MVGFREGWQDRVDGRAQFRGAAQSARHEKRRPGFLLSQQHGKEIVGLARVAKESYPDPTATEGDWSCRRFGPGQTAQKTGRTGAHQGRQNFEEHETGKDIEAFGFPVTKEEFDRIIELSG